MYHLNITLDDKKSWLYLKAAEKLLISRNSQTNVAKLFCTKIPTTFSLTSTCNRISFHQDYSMCVYFVIKCIRIKILDTADEKKKTNKMEIEND